MPTTLARRSRPAGLPSIFSVDPFSSLRDEFDQMLSNWFSTSENASMMSISPLLDLHEVDDNYEVQIDLPGVQANELKVQVSDNVLTISGERKYEKTEGKKGSTPRHVERSYGSFTRSVTLPGAVKQDKIDAQYKEGVLKITLPKSEEAKSRLINVKT